MFKNLNKNFNVTIYEITIEATSDSVDSKSFKL